jgi:UDP-2,4-diacetamido-2,4,6-trideoxy-beta-L-altropyranose hydrolase
MITALIRTDVGPGLGHLSRCAVLADALTQAGLSVGFLCQDPRSVAWINQRWPVWPVVNDPEDTQAALQALRPRLFVVDRYQWPWVQATWADTVLVIEDHPHAAPPPGCVWLNQNVFPDLLPAAPGHLLGPGFALLNPRLASLRRPWPRALQHAFISLGGEPPQALLQGILNGLPPHWSATVLTGFLDPQSLQPPGPRVTLLPTVPDATTHLAQADVVIGAGGVTLLEGQCLGLYSFVVPVADNQVQPAQNLLAATGLGQIVPAHADWTGLLAGLNPASINPARAMAVVDGQGVSRVVDYLLNRLGQGTKSIGLAK